MEESMCLDCNIPLQPSSQFRNGEVCPKCGIVCLSFTGGLGPIVDMIDHVIPDKSE